MSELFDTLKRGLTEAIEIEKNDLPAKKTTLKAPPIIEFSPSEIRDLRLKLGMTQHVFASFMGVSPKTVEAWEGGRTHPSGTAFRLMEILNNGYSMC